MRFGGSCRNLNCASSQQCLGLYEPCQSGLVDGTSCGHYVTCVDREGEIRHSERPASSSNVANDPKQVERTSTNVGSTDNSGGFNPQGYPQNPQGYPQSPQGYPQNPQGYPQNPQGYPQNPQGYPQNPQGYPQNPQGYPQNPQGYPQNPQGYPQNPIAPGTGNKQSSSDSDSGSGFSSFLNFLSGGNSGSSNSKSPDLGSLLSIIGKGTDSNNRYASNSGGGGGIDFSGLFNAFTGGGRESNQNTRNNFDNRNPTGQNPYPNSPNSGQNPNQGQDSGSGFLQTLGNFASSPLGQQLIIRAIQSGGKGNENDAQQNRRYGGLFSENPSKTTQTATGSESKGYPTQPPYSPYTQ
ncbi:Major prion protein like [Pseudolycoriella hygida]|uniref:Major prion protein like n=1 Tax=Pseudolycoriella hygida TaxID=35572 RepID=A0A9Q0N9X3_9DIPT|nr:Major prion protein like [Pseudolycoriella hygida]